MGEASKPGPSKADLNRLCIPSNGNASTATRNNTTTQTPFVCPWQESTLTDVGSTVSPVVNQPQIDDLPTWLRNTSTLGDDDLTCMMECNIKELFHSSPLVEGMVQPTLQQGNLQTQQLQRRKGAILTLDDKIRWLPDSYQVHWDPRTCQYTSVPETRRGEYDWYFNSALGYVQCMQALSKQGPFFDSNLLVQSKPTFRGNPTRRGGRKHVNPKIKFAKASHTIDVFFGNITSWSEQAKHYISTAAYDIAMVAESKLLEDDLRKELCALKTLGWVGSGAPAVQTCEKGISSGAMALVKRHWFSKPLANAVDPEGLISPGHRLTGRAVSVGRAEVLILGSYFLSRGNLESATNVDILKQVDNLTRGGKQPFILGADFNFTQDRWAESVFPWLRKLQAQVVVPTNSTYTCRQREGVENTLIDYFIVSNCLRPCIGACKVVFDTPWGPHFGVVLQINTQLDAAIAKQLIKPDCKKGDDVKFAEQAAQDQDQGSSNSKSKPCNRNPLVEPANADPVLWRKAMAIAEYHAVGHDALPGQREAKQACTDYALQLGIQDEANKIGHGLAL